MTLPESIKAAATIGTAQSQHSPLEDVNPALRELIQRKTGQSIEGQVLTTAFALHLQHQAGWIPPVMSKDTLPPCEPETRKACNAVAVRQLMLMLDGYYEPVLPEWLREVARSGQRAPEESLPLLLQLGYKKKLLRPLILPVLGERGLWLGRQVTTQQWDWFEPRNIERRWARGSDETRVELIELLREQYPDKARQLVEESWPDETSTMKIALLRTMQAGLSMSDEPFLENVLDDSSPQVRSIAKGLLSTLPESRYCQRMIERAASLLELATHKKKPVLRVRVFPTLDAAMQRDGIEGSGDRLLRRVIGAVPSRFWCDLWGISLDTLAEAIARSHDSDLENAFIVSVVGFNDTEFAEVLFPHLYDGFHSIYQGLFVPTLRPEFIEARAIERLNANEYRAADPVTHLLAAINDTWSLALGRAWLKSVNRLISQKNLRSDDETRKLLVQYAYRLPVELSDEFLSTLEKHTADKKVWQNTVDEVRVLLEFRQKMLAAIYEEA